MTVIPMQREPFEVGQVVVLCCSWCERDIVVVRVQSDFVERLSTWFGCDCEPERRLLDNSAVHEIVCRRIDTEQGIHVERWQERV